MQKYNEDFISKHLEKYPINLFELKNGGGVYHFSLEKIQRRVLSSHLDETNVVISLDCGIYRTSRLL